MKESRILRRARDEGELIRQRAAILQVLRTRFGATAADDFTATLDEMDEMSRLVPLLDLAVTCRNVAAFRTGLITQEATP